jgi:uncharacterized protein Yka (UPF0111/DUF47 family)
MIPKSDDIKPRHIEVADAIRDTINNLLEGVPELKSVGVVIDWNIGKNDFPFGMMIGREGMVRSPDELFSLMEQTAKFCNFQAKAMAEILVKTDARAVEVLNKIKAITEQLKELESRKDQISQERENDEKSK